MTANRITISLDAEVLARLTAVASLQGSSVSKAAADIIADRVRETEVKKLRWVPNILQLPAYIEDAERTGWKTDHVIPHEAEAGGLGAYLYLTR